MKNDEREEEREQFEEPSVEDFLIEEIDEEEFQRRNKRRSRIIKIGATVIALVLIANVFNIWLNLFTLDSIKFMKKSEQLSQEEMIQQLKQAVVTIQGSGSKGTGFVITSDGYILTNHHVVENMFPIMVSFPNGDRFSGEIVEQNEQFDLALLKVSGSNLPYITLSKQNGQVDERIIVIGNPLLHTQIVNDGYILEQSSGYDVLKISAPIYPGNSGSPVITEDGEVVGVVYARTIPTAKEETVGLAVPIEVVYEQIPLIKEIEQ